MKRFRFGEEGEMESVNMANVLMLLSRGGGEDMMMASTSPAREFECKTCSRKFPSFQALGGHRASHKRPRLLGDQPPQSGVVAKPKVHECSICGLEFAIGQALGGHMRRHRATNEGFGHAHVLEKKGDQGKRVLWLDLNLPPCDDDHKERRKIGLGLGLGLGLKLVEKTTPISGGARNFRKGGLITFFLG